MNIERLTALAEFLDRPAIPYEFNMDTWMELEGDRDNNWCGTECCLAGLAVLMFADFPINYQMSVQSHGAELLGLNFDQAHSLFLPYRSPVEVWADITPAMAAEAVRFTMLGDNNPWAI